MGTRNVEKTASLSSGSEFFRTTLAPLCTALVASLDAFESMQRRVDPGIVDHLRHDLRSFAELLGYHAGRLHSVNPPRKCESTMDALEKAVNLTLDALTLCMEPAGIEASFINFRKAARRIYRAQEFLYPLHTLLLPVNRFFLELPVRNKAARYDPLPQSAAPVGLRHIGCDSDPYARSGFSLFVPESYTGRNARPLVIALHGGFGHGRDFIWTWVREARSRQFLLAAPSAHSATWSITGEDVDADTLHRVLDYVSDGWNVDRDHVLLTGLSDGGTYALIRALDDATPFTAFAPVSGVLPPFDLRHVHGRRIYWVHGSLDWMFPIADALHGHTALAQAAADAHLQIVRDLSHTYPREQNDNILTWFDPSLALHLRA
jgi:phospholipase/carboxylesterase